MRKLGLAAAIVVVIAAPSVASAQHRQERQDRPRPSQQQQQHVRGWGDFQGALRAIAGSRLDRAHAQREKPPGNGKKQRHR
jgi:uncharacterized membrane protein